MKNIILDFLVVGAQKSGTTTVHDLLSESKEICLPWSKETHFFRDIEFFSKGWEWYERQFSERRKGCIFGEVDPEYMYFPECTDRIKQFSTAPKLVFVLREPLSRAYSHYLMSKRRGYEELTFENALAEEKVRISSGDRFSQIHFSYLSRGLYANQIERLIDAFPESERMFLRFEDLFPMDTHANEVIVELFQFIGAIPPNLQLDLSKHKNAASSPRFVLLRDFVYGNSIIKKVIGKFIPTRKLKIRVLQFVDRLNMRKLSSGLMHEYKMSDIPAEIYSQLIADVRRTEKLTGLDLSAWIRKYGDFAAKQ